MPNDRMAFKAWVLVIASVLLSLKCVTSQSFTHTGFLIDNYCWDLPGHIGLDGSMLETAPETHFVYCMLVGVCKASGYVFLESYVDNTTNTVLYRRGYQLDNDGDAAVIAFMETQNGNTQLSQMVSVTGQLNGSNALTLESGLSLIEQQVFTGFLVDNYCWNRTDHVGVDGANLEFAPETHSLDCLLLPPCQENGYTLMESYEDSGVMKYRPKYQLDVTGNALAISVFLTEVAKENRQLREQVRITGVLNPATENEIIVTALELMPLEQSFTGFLADNFCWNALDHIGVDGANLEFAPETHTTGCMLLPECRPDGYALLGKVDGAESYQVKYQLDDAGNELAIEFIENENRKDARQLAEMVTVTGILNDAGDTIMNISSIGLASNRTFIGYLIDNFCWNRTDHIAVDGTNVETTPQDHTLGCLLLPPCQANGYTLLESYESDDGMTLFRPRYQLNSVGNQLAIALFMAEIEAAEEGGAKALSEMVMITGELLDDGITISVATLELGVGGTGNTGTTAPPAGPLFIGSDGELGVGFPILIALVCLLFIVFNAASCFPKSRPETEEAPKK